ncbi:hypothetical protein LUZ60_007176 [Juncus effusus]|nr:hypothetical protein LUZ60_007176 [Juncus effusus]
MQRHLSTRSSPIINRDHLLSLSSHSSLLASYTVSPPVKPFPSPLTQSRLIALLRRLPDPSVSYQTFLYSLHYVPNFTPSFPVYLTLIHILASSRSYHLVPPVLSLLRRSGLDCKEIVFVSLIRSYGLASRPVDSLRMFLSIPSYKCRPTVRAFNVLLMSLIRNRKLRFAAKLFQISKSKFGIVPNVSTCNILLKALCGIRDLEAALNVLDEMPTMGIAPNLISYTTIISCHCTRGDMSAAHEWFDEIIKQGFVPDPTFYTVLILGYCNNGYLDQAIKIMDEMELNDVEPNEITYSVVIESCCKERKPGEALNLLDEMLDSNYIPNKSLCCKVIDVLCENGKVEEACEMWKRVLMKNVMHDDAISSTLIYWLCKKGAVFKARKLFDGFEVGFRPSLFTYNTLMTSLCENGELHEAARLWDNMIERNCKPNVVTYNVFINGFCKVGKAKEALCLFEEMVEKGFKVSKVTFRVLVNGLFELGNEEIIRVIKCAKLGGNNLLDTEFWEIFVRKFVSVNMNWRENLQTVIEN